MRHDAIRVVATLCVAGAAATAAAQSPDPRGVVDVLGAGSEGRIGFVAASRHVIASVPASAVDAGSVRLRARDGSEHEAQVVRRDRLSGLSLLRVPGLSLPPYAFAAQPADAGQRVYGASPGAPGIVGGRIERIDQNAWGPPRTPSVLRHDLFADPPAYGAPLLNACGHVVGVRIEDRQVTQGSELPGYTVAMPGDYFLHSTTLIADLDVATAPCGSAPEPVGVIGPPGTDPARERAEEQDARRRTEALAAAEAERVAAEAAAAAARQRLEEAEQRAEAEAAARQLAEVEALAATERQRSAEARAAAEARRRTTEQTARREAEAAQELAEVSRQQAEAAAVAQAEAAAAARYQAETDRRRYLFWAGVVGGGGGIIALFTWWVGRRSVSRTTTEKLAAEGKAQEAQALLADRMTRDELADKVPAVFLDGVDAGGRAVAVRIPGHVIANENGAVVGRNPLHSAIVLNHEGVSRRHFRLSAKETTVMVEDLHSTNGTTLNAVRLKPGDRATLRHGARLAVGDLEFTVQM